MTTTKKKSDHLFAVFFGIFITLLISAQASAQTKSLPPEGTADTETAAQPDSASGELSIDPTMTDSAGAADISATTATTLSASGGVEEGMG